MQALFQKIGACFIGMIVAFLSVFGVSFEHREGNEKAVYSSVHASPGPNAKTDELKALFGEVKQHEPAVTPCPEKDPYPEDGRITAIWYEGEVCGGRTPRVFAYIGFPANASAGNKVPAVVTVHGGGCHAWAEWVQYWVDQGYAAISMDGFAQTYTGPAGTYDHAPEHWTVDPEGHLPMDNFATRDKPFKEQWFYYFISDIILAHNVLRADERVDTARVGLTGISWGGFASSIAVCYDDRFAFAAPMYGSGFQDISKTPWGQVFRGEGVSDVWDAELLLPEVQTPVHWFTGDNDPYFSADAAAASAAAAPNGAVTLLPEYPHGMMIDLAELLRFANEQTGMGEGNIKIEKVSFDDETAVVSFTLPADVKNAELRVYYRSSPLEYGAGELKELWQSKKGLALGGSGTVRIPEEATMFYFAVTGKTGSVFRRETVRATTGIYERAD